MQLSAGKPGGKYSFLKNGAGEAIQPPKKIGFSKKKSTVLPAKYCAFLVENSGIEPLTSCMPCKRSPERYRTPPENRV